MLHIDEMSVVYVDVFVCLPPRNSNAVLSYLRRKAVHRLSSLPVPTNHGDKKNIVTYRSIARQRLGKHIPAEAYARNNRTSIARQRISKQALSTIERLCFLHGPCRGVIK
jgi:hypothetical protein